MKSAKREDLGGKLKLQLKCEAVHPSPPQTFISLMIHTNEQNQLARMTFASKELCTL